MIAWAPAMGRLLAGVTFVVSFAFSYGPGTTQMSLPASLPASLLVSAGAAWAVWLSGVRPVAGLVVAVATTVLLPVVGATFDGMGLVLVAVGFQASMRSAMDPWVLSAVVFGALSVNDVWLRVEFDRPFVDPSILNPALMTVLAVGLGWQSRRVVQQNHQLISLHEADRQRAVSDERRRIARDLHDVAAHHLSAIIVRNRLARRVRTVDALDAAAEFTADTAADALDAVRQVVSVLGTDGQPPLSPQPSFADLDAVVQRVRSAGLDVEWDAQGPVPEAPADVQIAVVRIVQESLANVLRHRGPGRAWLHLDRDRDDVVQVTVEDDGPSAWRSEMDDPSWHRVGSHGLVGMRERAEACGGLLEVGPSTRGGWRVSALLPVSNA